MIQSRTIRLGWVALAVSLLTALPAHAAFISVAQPDAAYVSGTKPLPITDPDFTAVASLSDGIDTVSFDVDLVALTVPTTWASWGSPPDTEGATPRVLWTNGFTSVTLTFSNPLAIFGLEAQPNTAVVSPITASFFDGATLLGEITRDVDGFGGARLFAGLSTTPFDRVVLSSTDDFAIAQVRLATKIPQPAAGVKFMAAAAMGLAAHWYRVRRRRQAG